MASLRYALAIVALSDVWLVGRMVGWPRGGYIARSYIWINLFTRLYSLYFVLGPGVSRHRLFHAPPGLLVAATVVAVAFALCWWTWRRGSKLGLCLGLAGTAVALLLAPSLVDYHRRFWLPRIYPAIQVLFDAVPSTVYLVAGGAGGSSYPVAGRGFRHRVLKSSEKDLLSVLDSSEDPSKYVVFQELDSVDGHSHGRLVRALLERGYIKVDSNPFTAVFHYRDPAAVRERIEQAWYVEDLDLLASEQPSAQESNSRGAARLPWASSSPLGLWRREADGFAGIGLIPNVRVHMVNLGGLGGDGALRGLPLKFEGDAWLLENETLESLSHNFSISSFSADNKSDRAWQFRGEERPQVEDLEMDGERFIRLTAIRPLSWMAAVRAIRDLPDLSALTLIATVRVGANRSVNTHFYDFEDGRAPESDTLIGNDSQTWQYLVMSRDFGLWRGQDYFAVGMSQPAAGDYVDIRDVRIVRAAVPGQVRVPVPNDLRARTR